MMGTIMDTMPKDAGGGEGKSLEDIVKEICNNFLS